MIKKYTIFLCFISIVLGQISIGDVEGMTNEDLDEMIENSINQAVKLCGNDVGVPIIVLNDGKKEKAIFGPIISNVPNLQESLEMWEHFKYICFNENIHELKRERFIPLGL